MGRVKNPIVICSVLLLTSAAHGQFGRGVGDWSTSGGDAHRSSWVRSDPKISRDAMQRPGFQLLWKINLDGSKALTTPAVLTGYIGYRGFRTLGFVGGSSDTVYAMDTDLARMEWQKHFPGGSPQAGGSSGCTGGMTANVTRPVTTAFPAPPGGGGGGRGSGGARSAVGETDQGAAILATMAEQAVRAAAAAASGPPPGNPGRGASGGGGFGGRTPNFLDALSSDGLLHVMYVSNGDEPDPAVRFLPPNANAVGLIVIGTMAYTVTTRGCGGVENGVWALDIPSKQVFKWLPKSGEIAGSAGPAFGSDGTVYVATTEGSVLALDPKSLVPKDTYTAKGQAFASSPVVFQYKEKTLIAAASKDGRIHVLDSASLGGSDHQTPLYVTSKAGDIAPGALTSWMDSDGTRRLLASSSNGVVAWKMAEENGAISLQSGWTSPAIASPYPPMVINGVVFAVSGGSAPAVLYALDGATGKELWNSGKTMTSPVHGGAMAGGGSQVYLGGQDGALYAFGYPIEH